MSKKVDRYICKIKLSKEDKIKVDKKLDKFLKNKKCVICNSKKVYLSDIPLEIKAHKKLNKRIYHRNHFIIRYCENCGYTQFFDLNSLNINL